MTTLPDMARVPLQQLRTLTLSAPPGVGSGAFFAAASGIVLVGDTVFVVADDENQLGIFARSGTAPGKLYPLFDRVLPADEKARKAAKPDLENLTLIESQMGGGQALLAFGSGSTPARKRGAMVKLDGAGQPTGSALLCDLTPLYAVLQRQLSELNIEAMTVSGKRLLLFQRGNGAKGQNAIIALHLDRVLAHCAKAEAVSADVLIETRMVDLGRLGSVRLSFTDAHALPDGRIVFVASAEDSPNTYDDGVVVGSVVGLIETNGQISNVSLLEPNIKAEGVHATLKRNGVIDLLIVNDADDRHKPATLYSGALTLGASL